jgi:tripartite-type tricarboxylate transporter receptor subunit TctC
MDTPQWKKFSEEWYFAPDSHMAPEQFGKWVAGEVDLLDRLVKEFGLRK